MRGDNKVRKPNLFIVGAGRSGTTALHAFLKQHPDIFMSDPKELWYFCLDLKQDVRDYCRKNGGFSRVPDFYKSLTEKDYLKFFAGWKSEKVAGESTPACLHSKVAARKIHKFNPEAKIIIMLRNPVDWMYSVHAHNVHAGRESAINFEKALELEKERRRGNLLPKKVFSPSSFFYSQRASFAYQVKRYYDLFDKKQIKVIIFDDFEKDNAGIYREVLEFLGVDPNFTPKFKKINANKKPKFTGLLVFFKAPFFTKISELPMGTLPQPLALKYKKFRNLIFGSIFNREQPRPSMDSELRRKLMKKFKPEVERLGKILNRDLTGLWGYDTV